MHEIIRDEFTLKIIRDEDGTAMLVMRLHPSPIIRSPAPVEEAPTHAAVRVFYEVKMPRFDGPVMLSQIAYEPVLGVNIEQVLSTPTRIEFDAIKMVTVELLCLTAGYERLKIG